MIQLVGDDVVFGREDGGDGAGIGGESRLEDHACFGVLEIRDALFQLHMDAHGAGNGADGARADAVLFDGCDGRRAEFGMGGET